MKHPSRLKMQPDPLMGNIRAGIVCIVLLLAFISSCSRPVRNGTVTVIKAGDTLKPPVVVKIPPMNAINLDACPPPRTYRLPESGAPATGTGRKIHAPSVKSADFYVSMQQYNMQQYNTEQGLALSAVPCSYRDRMGQLWFGTAGGGVSRFDGRTFTTFTTTQGLASNTVWSIAEDAAGNMWFGTSGGGVSKYDGVTFTNYTTAQGLGSNTVYCILQDRAGMLWFGTAGGGISRYDGTAFTTYTTAQGLAYNEVLCGAVDSSGALWFGTYGGGVSRFDGSKFTNFSTAQGLPDSSVRSILCDRSGALWFGTLGSGVCKYDGTSFTTLTRKQGLTDDNVVYIAQDHAGKIWFGTYGGGVSAYDGTSFINFTTAQGLSDNWVLSIISDRAGNLWFGTLAGGVCRYDGESLRSYSKEQGLGNNTVWSISDDGRGNLWFGMTGGTLCRFNGVSFANFSMPEGLSDKDILSIIRDRAGNLWIGTYGEGVYRFDGKIFTNYTTAQGLVHNNIRCCAEDREGNMWFGSADAGVSKFDGKSFVNFTKKQGLANNAIWCISEDHAGDIWFGTEGGGISRYDGNRVAAVRRGDRHSQRDLRDLTYENNVPVPTFTNYTTSQGLAHNQVYSILADSSDNLWCGTAGGGVSRFDGRTFMTISTVNGIPDDNVYCVRMEPSGPIVFGTNRGLTFLTGFTQTTNDRADKGNLLPSNTLTNRELHNYTPVLEIYNQSTGYPIKDVNTNAVFCDEKGIIWAGTGERLVRFDRGDVHIDTEPLNLVIQSLKINNTAVCWRDLERPADQELGASTDPAITEEVTTFGTVLTDAQRDTMRNKFGNISFEGVTPFHPLPVNLVLPYDHNNVTFDFAAIEPSRRNSLVRYQYMLEGYDEDWSTVTEKTSASFGNMSEGKYTFMVRAKSPEGVWSRPVAYSFRVLPPLWRTWWMYLLYAAVFISALWSFIQWRERASQKEREILRASEERYRLIVETANEGVWRFDQHHATIFANSRMCEMLEYPFDEMVSKKMTDFMDAQEAFVYETDATGKLKFPVTMEVEFITKTGKRIWVHAANSEVLDDAGNFTGALSMVTDITERRKAEDELRRHREHLEDLVQERTSELNEKNLQLDAANRSKSEFLANMSHEIRTPMNSIIGFSDVLYTSLKDEKQRSQVHSIRASGKTLLKIINDILDLSKIEAGKMTIQYESVNLRQMSNDLEIMFSQKSSEKGIDFSIEMSDNLPRGLLLDETRLRQVLFNLVGNAVKFTEKGGVVLSISGRPRSLTAIDLVISVKDTGIGIPQDQQELIFAPFTQQIGQQEKKYGGTGLGLAICRRLVEIMNGSISLESTPGEGSTFTVVLPDVAMVEEAKSLEDKPLFDPTSVVFKPARVLIVDDNRENRLFLRDLLDHLRLNIIEAENGEDAVEKARSLHPDIILMDLRMPVMNGYEAAGIIRTNESGHPVPVIATSASVIAGMDDARTEGLFDAFLMKPIDAMELLGQLKRFLPTEPQPPSASQGGEAPVIELDEDQLRTLPELIRVLEDEFIPLYTQVAKRQLMGQIRDFGSALIETGEKTDWKPLIDFGLEICSYADQFYIERLMKKLKSFPAFVESLKARMEIEDVS